jgi:hypothetical protein
MAKATHNWIAHPTEITDKIFVEESYKVLADSRVGPMIAEH